MRKPYTYIAVATCVAAAAVAIVPIAREYQDARTFEVTDPKGVNTIIFLCDSPLEPIAGFATGIQGTLTFDKENISESTASVRIPAAQFRMGSEAMTGDLMSAGWLDAENHEYVTLEIRGIDSYEELGENDYRLQTTGHLTIRDTTQEVELDLLVRDRPEQLPVRMRGAEGDLLSVRTTFTFDRRDFEFGPSMPHVGNVVEVTVALACTRRADATFKVD